MGQDRLRHEGVLDMGISGGRTWALCGRADRGARSDATLLRAGRSRAVRRMLAAALVAVLALSGCGVTRDDDGGENRRLRMMIPNSPGGGYDQTGRAATRVME